MRRVVKTSPSHSLRFPPIPRALGSGQWRGRGNRQTSRKGRGRRESLLASLEHILEHQMPGRNLFVGAETNQ